MAANSTSLRPGPRRTRSIHGGSIRPYSTSPLASRPGNIASGRDGSFARVGPRGANQPKVYGGR